MEETFWDSLQIKYQASMNISDPRTADWLLIQEPWTTVYLVIGYLAFVAIGPRIMKERQPMDLHLVMLLYNLLLVILNLYISYEIIASVIALKYTWLCDTVEYQDNDKGARLAAALWWFYFSKIIELLDTVIFILRKKDNQVTFLHVYHHTTMPLLWWIGVRWYAGGVSFFSALINSMIHVIMYSYYHLSAYGESVRPYLWWKKYLTMLQLGQFVLVLIQTLTALFIGCDYDWRPEVALVLYLLSHIALFSNFYHKTYKTNKKE